MTQEDKDLLLKDLCARLPYGVILDCCEMINEPLTLISCKGLVNNDYDIDEVKPYLFPISSMTEEQKREYARLLTYTSSIEMIQISGESTYDWLNKNMFDWRGLIPMGLALDATGLNIY